MGPLHCLLMLHPLLLLPMGVWSQQHRGEVEGVGGEGVAWTAPAWRNSRGSKDQGAQLPGSGGALASRIFAKCHWQRDKGPEDANIWRRHRGYRGGETESRRNLRQVNPPPQGTTGTWVQAEGGKGRGAPARERRKIQACGTGHKDKRPEAGGWRVAGAGNAQVGGASHWERRWGAGETRGIRWGTAADGEAVLKRGGNEQSRNKRRKRWGGISS